MSVLLLQGLFLRVEAQTDSLYFHLDSTTFVSSRNTSAYERDGQGLLKVDMEGMQKLPKLMGNNDPVHFVRLLPGVQTNSDNDSGIHIQGCDNSHNEISLGGVPVYGVNHLLGLFSVFNPFHYSSMEYSGNSSSNRLGGMLNMTLPEPVPEGLTGDFSIGMMAVQGSFAGGYGEKSSLRLSARRSYLGLLYKPWMKFGESPFSYGFGDYNATYTYSSGKNKVWADLYLGNDSMVIGESTYGLDMPVDWRNTIAALHWERSSDALVQRHSLYYSGYAVKGSIYQEKARAFLYSSISSAGYKGTVIWNSLTSEAEIICYDVRPQCLELTGIFNDYVSNERQRSLESSLSGSYSTRWDRLGLDAAMKASFYISDDGHEFWGASPRVSFDYNLYRWGRVRAEYGLKHQFLFQTGMTNIGFPIEFWLLSGSYSRPQYCQYLELGYDTGLFNDILHLSVDVYGKLLYNQMEYKGSMLDIFMSEYDLNNNLLKGRGWNYGLDINLHKRSGNPTGWISYSWGRSLRSFDNPEYPSIYPSNHERIHELNAVCTYDLGKKWSFSGTFIYAGGVPFTAPESFYISSGKIITNYGEHNAERMNPYIRLDLSADYLLFEKDGRKSGLNLSIHNVLARDNDVMYRIYLYDDGFSFGGLSFPLKLLPSISYYYRF